MKFVIAILAVIAGSTAFAGRTNLPLLVASQGINYRCEIYSNKVVLRIARMRDQETPVKLNVQQIQSNIYAAAQASRDSGNYAIGKHAKETKPAKILLANFEVGSGNAEIILHKNASDVRTLKGPASLALRKVLQANCPADR
ncbi:MAG: hypothetical protein ABL958_10680 [Bdellovibrionia bacterium]